MPRASLRISWETPIDEEVYSELGKVLYALLASTRLVKVEHVDDKSLVLGTELFDKLELPRTARVSIELHRELEEPHREKKRLKDTVEKIANRIRFAVLDELGDRIKHLGSAVLFEKDAVRRIEERLGVNIYKYDDHLGQCVVVESKHCTVKIYRKGFAEVELHPIMPTSPYPEGLEDPAAVADSIAKVLEAVRELAKVTDEHIRKEEEEARRIARIEAEWCEKLEAELKKRGLA